MPDAGAHKRNGRHLLHRWGPGDGSPCLHRIGLARRTEHEAARSRPVIPLDCAAHLRGVPQVTHLCRVKSLAGKHESGSMAQHGSAWLILAHDAWCCTSLFPCILLRWGDDINAKHVTSLSVSFSLFLSSFSPQIRTCLGSCSPQSSGGEKHPHRRRVRVYYTILCYSILCCTILYYTILYYTILFYSILYYTIL